MVITSTILLGFLAFFLTILLVIRHLLKRQECKLGYPKPNENFEDVKLLMLLQQDIFALRCYRRIYPQATLQEAKYMIEKLSQQLNSLPAQSVAPKSSMSQILDAKN